MSNKYPEVTSIPRGHQIIIVYQIAAIYCCKNYKYIALENKHSLLPTPYYMRASPLLLPTSYYMRTHECPLLLPTPYS